MKIKPLRDIVVVERDGAADTTEAGILLVPKKADAELQTGTVIAVGPGIQLNGQLDTMDIQVGDKVLYNKGTGQVCDVEKKPYLFIKQRDLMGVLR